MGKRQTLLKRLGNQNSWGIKKIIIVLSVLLGITLVVFCGAYFNVTEIKKQMQQNLTDVAKQNAEILHSKIHAEYELLNALSNELDGVTPDTINEKLEHFEILMEDFNLKRFAFCFPDGTTYSTDTEDATDLSYRDFFQEGLKGKSYITGILSDALKEGHNLVNVMTIPLFDEAEDVIGVFGLAYDTDIFNESLQIDSFDGQGYSCILNENGDIIATKGNDGLTLSLNLVEDVLKSDTKNEQTIKDIQECIEQNKEANGILYLSGKNFYSCVPVNLMDNSVTWHVLTIIPSEVLNQRIAPILGIQYASCLCILVLVLLGAMIVIMFIKEQHKQMLLFAYEDPVTQGTNYTKFCLEMDKTDNPLGYLIAMDIANFNNISIVAGQAASDTMVKETWEIINNSLLEEELAGHVSDDNFLLFLTEQNEDKLLHRIKQISEQITEKAKGFRVYGIQAGYGIYLMSEKETMESAYSKAKIARESAVINPKLCYAFYDEVNRKKIQHKKHLEERFPKALEKKEFKVWYQPKYSAADCAVVGSEALVRWQKEDGTMISPGEFIPLFEQNGMIMKLDEYMFRAVCSQQKKWLDEGKVIYPVSINMSRATLYSADVDKRYGQIMQEYGISPKYIQLEITETVMDKGADICELLNKFRQMGIKILMDDFGTGYSSFATLSTQCFDTLKLDKTLIDHIGNKNGETMLYHIILMGQQMGLHITAEGVEEKTQLTFLQNLKCDDIQGFYFSKPIPTAEYEALLNNHQTV